MAGKMDASTISRQAEIGLYKTINLDALLIATKRLYGVLILIGAAVLVYVSLLNFEGLIKRRMILLRKRLKGKTTKGYIREVELQETEELKEEIKAASAVAV